ncbi:uncharacterized protein RCC_00007 [Ramularia collo-cygni]|uniref:MYND-type domain-containing protein n=1 Tax=Ramularia collo-cygni TaxID=112498 RepID=A0A2D3UL80_9PEZI|nr:uncharacterized protein RCC_00007 [Ramularia collo-cygni]CZT14032.1 uncharacterized protein RCC_00007 [Ramularia collo-cygni]
MYRASQPSGFTPFLSPMTVPPGCKETALKHSRVLRMTARLGLPLRFGIVGNQAILDTSLEPEIREHQENPGLAGTACNAVLKHLSINKSPVDKTIAFNDVPGLPNPVIMLGRMDDGDYLNIEDVHAMWAFIDEAMTNSMAKEQHATDSESLSRSYESFHAHMTPENFIKFWEDEKKCPDFPRGKLQCPVSLACKACGKIEEGKMMRCGKCEVVKYCGVDCQKLHWSAHKLVCSKH